MTWLDDSSDPCSAVVHDSEVFLLMSIGRPKLPAMMQDEVSSRNPRQFNLHFVVCFSGIVVRIPAGCHGRQRLAVNEARELLVSCDFGHAIDAWGTANQQSSLDIQTAH